MLFSSSFAAAAADLGGYRQQRGHVPATEPHRHFYVRGDVGVARNTFGSFSQAELTANEGTFLSKSIADNVVIGAGLGMQLNSRFRVDLTGEYRSTAQVRALDNVTAELVGPDGTLQANTSYQGNLASHVGLFNAYLDLVKWRGFTPYVGAGIGAAHHKTSGFVTQTSATFTDAATGAVTTQMNNGVAAPHSQTNLAWALMAGTSYDLSANAKLDIGYRYLNLGKGVSMATGQIDCVCGTVGSPLKVSDLNSHEVRIGVRWMLGESSVHQPMK